MVIESLSKKIAKEAITFLNKSGNYSSREKVKGVLRANKEKLAHHFLQFLPQNKNLIGLDIGAGDGEFAELTRKVSPRVNMYSGERFIQNGERKEVPFVQTEAEKLPLADESLDFVVALYAFHHFENKETAFQEALRVLKPGGILFIKEEFPRYPGQEWLLKINDEVSNEVISTPDLAAPFIETVDYFSRDELKNIITAAQLHVLEDSGSKPIRWIEWLYKTHKRLFVLQKPDSSS